MKSAKEIADSIRWLANSRVRELTPGMLAEKHHESIANALWMVADQVEGFQAEAFEEGRKQGYADAVAAFGSALEEQVRKLKEAP